MFLYVTFGEFFSEAGSEKSSPENSVVKTVFLMRATSAELKEVFKTHRKEKRLQYAAALGIRRGHR